MKINYTNQFVKSASDRIVELLQLTLRENSHFLLSLCGGSTPVPIYEALSERSADIPWSRVIITFGDERCVPPDHHQSNYRMADGALLSRVEIPEHNVLRMEGELDPHDAALRYESKLREAANSVGREMPSHDLVLLGVGDDGHTASLFPETEALKETNAFVAANFVPRLRSWRLTLTLPCINSSKNILFLVNDEKKYEIVSEVASGLSSYPAAQVAPRNGSVEWIVGPTIPKTSS